MNPNYDKKIAVVGLGVLFPDAKNIDQFWQNIINKKVSIREMPEEIFESEIYYRPDLLTSINKKDKSYTRVAAWIEDTQYDTVRKYKIPPSMAERMDENQHAALYSTDQVLQSNPLQNVAKDRVGVIFGNGMVGTAYGDALVRVQFQLIEHYLRQHPGFTRFPEKEQNEIIEYEISLGWKIITKYRNSMKRSFPIGSSRRKIIDIITKIIEKIITSEEIMFENYTGNTSSLNSYLFTIYSTWFWFFIIISIITTLSVIFISEENILFPIRFILGLLYIYMIPGFLIYKILNPLIKIISINTIFLSGFNI